MWKNSSVLEKVLFFLLVLLSAGSLYYVFTSGWVLTYNDAASHLNIARRIVDNLTPGLAQIGTVWLPLPHILMLLFAWNNLLWHTGLAGSIVSMFAYVIFVVFVYRTLILLTKNKWSAVIGAFVAATSPNLLYLQSTPMTEPLLLAVFALTTYFFVSYMQKDKPSDLILTGICITLATLTRYDGWFLYFTIFVVLIIRTFILKGWKKTEGALMLFLTMGGLGIGLWLLWNLTIFGDALYFITGPYSAYAQQKILQSVGQLPTQGNLLIASTYFGWSMLDNNGIVIILLAMFGAIFAIIKSKGTNYLPLLAILAAPFIFNVLALYIGQSAMNVPQAASNPGYFNIRYGLLVLPSLAILIGLLANNKILRYFVITAVALQIYLFVITGKPVTLIDGLQGLNNTYYTVEAGSWLKHNYNGGLILTSLASHDAFVARAGIPMKNYIHEGTREHWSNSLKKPSGEAEYITLLTFPPDVVYKAIEKNPDFKNNYTLVYSYEKFEIYKRK